MSSALPDATRPAIKRSEAKPTKSVTIIGAGPGGLAAGILLAHAGVQVRIVERMHRVGGRCSSIEADGFRFDLGPTFFLYPRVLQRIYQIVGRDLMKEIPMVRLDPQYKLIFGGGQGELECTPNLDRMAAEVAKIAPNDAKNVHRFIAENRIKLERFRPALESPFLGLSDLLSWDLLKMLPILRPWSSVDGELQRYFADPRVRLAFTFQSKYLGMSPFNCPSLFSILSYLEYDFGVWHPIGGCGAVSEGMARLALELGVQIHLGEPVQKMLFDGKRAIGVATNRGEYHADAIVVNADFAQTMTKLVPDQLRRRWTDAKIEKKRFSCSTFMMYLGIEGRYDELAHHTIATSADYIGNLDDIERTKKLSDDPSIYVQNASRTDPTLAPSGMSTLYILAPVPHRSASVNWVEQKEPFRKKVLQQLEKLGVMNLEKRIRYEKIITTADWENEYQVYKGATFNLAHSLDQMLCFRPRNRFEDLDGVYLVGGGTHPGSGLPVIYESARITSRLLLQDFGLPIDWLGVPGAPEENGQMTSSEQPDHQLAATAS